VSGTYFSSLYSGSGGNVSFAATRASRVLIDAGMPAVRIEQALADIGSSLAEIDGVLITHEHIDHIRSAGALARRYNLTVYANEATWRAMEASGKVGDIPRRNRVVFDTGRDFYVGDICVSSFPVAHDTAEPVGFVLWGEGRGVAVATDLGHMTRETLARLREADAVMLEANHDIDMLTNGRYPESLKRRILGKRGHLSNAAAGEALRELMEHGLRRVALAHLSQDNNTPETAYRTVASALEAAGARIGRDIQIAMTRPDRPGMSWPL
jgi:phosphoribosyl 1,2-cyclic phosphodiesterase